MEQFQVSAPGRVCLFGEHQDYLGLSVVPSAINMRTAVKCYDIDTSSKHVVINAKDLGKMLELEIKPSYDFKDPDLGYFQAVITTFQRHGHLAKIPGFACDVTSKIPIKSGLSSSAALLVAFTKAIATLCKVPLTPQEIGWYAYEAEHDVMGIPCGMMDQLSSAIGGIIHLKCSTPPVITPLAAKITGIVVADTKIHKSTSNVHSIRVKETKGGLANLKKYIDFDIETTPWEKIEPHLKKLDDIERKRLTAVFRDRDITVKCMQLLNEKVLDYPAIGKLLTEHQMYLNEYFEVSVEKIETILANAVKAGALGGKLTGAGLGGSVVILAPGKEKEVSKAIIESDGIPYVVAVDQGVQ
ncbi:MAG: galactokinase family protein [Candidatus Sigynarchaeota archaeon]